MPKRREAAGEANTSCVRKRKVEEVILIESDSDDGDAPVICIESDCPSDDGDTPVVTLDSGCPTHRSDAAAAGQSSEPIDDDDEFPSFSALMYEALHGERPREQEPEDMRAQVKATRPTRFIPSVDPLCTSLGPVIVYASSKAFYNAMLTQTCLQKNMNKFYAIQVLEDPCKRCYYFWCRWGRVGDKGIFSMKPCGTDVVMACTLFERKFFQKTKNEWSEHHNFVKYSGKYDMLKVDYTEADTESDNIEKRVVDLANDTIKSRLEPSLKHLMTIISDLKGMQQSVINMKFDVIKMPLGKLKREQIREGYKALCKIEDCINKSSSQKELMDACSNFYTCIPHSFKRSQRPEMIKTHEEVQMKMWLLEALEDIETALALMKKGMQDNYKHPLDKLYSSLGCELTEIDHRDSDFCLIRQAITNTHGKTHVGYRLCVQSVFRVDKKSKEFSSVGNHRMLWHGSRASNFAGILSQGLRIAPPDVPCNGYMFGKGVYFADCASKSANYCLRDQESKEGLLLLCEVSLGDMHLRTVSMPRGESLPSGKHSVKGVGSFFPDPWGDAVMKTGVPIACGPLLKCPSIKSSLMYNEYIVYKTNQVRMAYLVRVKFDWSC